MTTDVVPSCRLTIASSLELVPQLIDEGRAARQARQYSCSARASFDQPRLSCLHPQKNQLFIVDRLCPKRDWFTAAVEAATHEQLLVINLYWAEDSATLAARGHSN